MSKPNRMRDVTVTFRMSEEESTALEQRIQESGTTKQNYIIGTLLGRSVVSNSQVDELKETNKALTSLLRQIGGMATNVNQMAHVANGQGILPAEMKMKKIYDDLKVCMEEVEKIWRSIRSLISQRRVTGQ